MKPELMMVVLMDCIAGIPDSVGSLEKTKNSPESMAHERASPRYELLNYGGGNQTRLISGAVTVDDPAASGLVDALPEMVVMQTETPGNNWLVGLTRLIMIEARVFRSLHENRQRSTLRLIGSWKGILTFSVVERA